MAKKKTRRNATPKKDRRPVWIRAFLSAFADTGNVRLAAEAAKKNRATVYRRKETDPAFAAEYDVALEDAADTLEFEARRRAHAGVDEPVIHQGELSGLWVDAEGKRLPENEKMPETARFIPLTVKKYSDTLLIFLLKGMRPEKFRDNHKHEMSGPGGKPIEHEHVINTTERIAQLAAAFEGVADRAGTGGAPGDGP